MKHLVKTVENRNEKQFFYIILDRNIGIHWEQTEGSIKICYSLFHARYEI